MNIRPTSSRADIEANTIIETNREKPRFQVYCAPGYANIAGFAIQNPGWTSNRVSQGDAEKWSGTKSYQESVNLLRNGWPEGTAKSQKLIGRFQPKLPKSRKVVSHFRPSYAPVGQLVINVHDIVSGGPQPFIGRFKRQETVMGGRKIIRILYSCGASGVTNTDVMEARGAAVNALIHTFERLKMSVDLTLLAYAQTSSIDGLYFWHLKPAGMTINEDQMAFATVNPSAFRRMMFAMIEHSPAQYCESFYAEYGGPASIKSNHPDIAAKYDLILDTEIWNDTNWKNEDSIVAWIRTQLVTQGVESV